MKWISSALFTLWLVVATATCSPLPENSALEDDEDYYDESYGFPSETNSGESTDDILFLLYEKGSDDFKELKINRPFTEDLHNYYRFDPTKKTKILIHGWLSSGTDNFCKYMKDAYMKYNDYNIISVDWSKFSIDLYSMARVSVDLVAPYVATLYHYLITEMGAKPADIHVIGHSLGAHVAGLASKALPTYKIGRITGLDPALPLFFFGRYKRLDAMDADFVDIIHTSIVGFRKQIGHADFYPNGDKLQQPGCGFNIGACAHDRAYEYFIESISNPNGFLAVECSSWYNFEAGTCQSNAVATMGESTNTKSRGKFILRTSSSSPFALGKRFS